MNKFEIAVEEKEIDDAIAELKTRYGKMSNPEVSVEGDSLFGTLSQASSEFEKDGLVEIAKVEKKLQGQLIGIKKDEEVKFDIQKLFKEVSDLELLTGLKPEEVKELQGEYTFKVKNVNHVEPAEMNQEFFDKIFGDGKVKSEAEFRDEYNKIFEENYDKESEYLLAHQLQEKLIKNTKIEIPEDFYKKWILATNKEISQENIDKDFEHYVRDLKWTLIKNKVAEENELKVEPEEMVEYTKKMFKAQFGGMALNEEMEANLNVMANNYLQQNNGENYMNIYNQLNTEKILDILKQKADLTVKKVSREEFNKQSEN